ncbi:MAG TPA: aromatic ring-hydroxylating dioxygenase subunit alpha [Steroidobacteraceae bacterium]|jgi:phenylpropionate dioxygenase-like ring-hydroxylating dioxygenase large terminal subunit|nr:aromatic ring-hydroxylating dioxygenase subunit alpha [Steroidobacteraceae bacterium]
MTQYRDNPGTISALVRGGQVHRDVYINRDLFDLEMERLWHSAWIYVGHESQVPLTGDYYTTEIARRPILMTRAQDGAVRVFYNRCAHRGAKLVSATSGNCGGILRCPYHGWTYRLDGTLRTMPLKDGYANTGFAESPAALGLSPVPAVALYRGFVFARLNRDGPDLGTYFGDSLSSIDNMADRSPAGRLEVAGGTLRYMHHCNWKMFIENLNDTMHPMVAHESSAGTARDLWKDQPPDAPKPMVIEQFVPFVSNYDFFDKMGVKIYDNGHSYTGVNFSIHSKYSSLPEYEAQMTAAYGAERAHAILAEVRHNTVYYPSLTVKGAIQTIRVVRPIAVDRTLIESFTLRLVGAPESLLERSVMYNRLINAPTSVVGHDDMHCYQAIQEGLESEGNEWVNLHRNYSSQDEARGIAGTHNGTSEVSVRGQFRAWLAAMTADAAVR